MFTVILLSARLKHDSADTDVEIKMK